MIETLAHERGTHDSTQDRMLDLSIKSQNPIYHKKRGKTVETFEVVCFLGAQNLVERYNRSKKCY